MLAVADGYEGRQSLINIVRFLPLDNEATGSEIEPLKYIGKQIIFLASPVC